MATRSGMYKSNKRRKELSRQKKQEEKRLKRQKGGVKVPPQDPAGTETASVPDSDTGGDTEKQ